MGQQPVQVWPLVKLFRIGITIVAVLVVIVIIATTFQPARNSKTSGQLSDSIGIGGDVLVKVDPKTSNRMPNQLEDRLVWNDSVSFHINSTLIREGIPANFRFRYGILSVVSQEGRQYNSSKNTSFPVKQFASHPFLKELFPKANASYFSYKAHCQGECIGPLGVATRLDEEQTATVMRLLNQPNNPYPALNEDNGNYVRVYRVNLWYGGYMFEADLETYWSL